MRAFFITIGQKRQPPRLAFEAIALDAMMAVQQHADLAMENERIEVRPVPTEAQAVAADVERNTDKAHKAHEREDSAAMELQLAHFRAVGII